ncbi:hypothetical protein NZ698_14320 [Chryseobacterium sp. PBS4-4]|uniref:Bacteriocin n=1 Tax=Chryseobacterium edaphi TaxID=2976532 RepID=A0ABT2W823_9FLAO|nr:hypothetical protein [Chryseobacterium edaphi]MCU7618372.1 hypothetical protein [Chryseobacterium edaphi]
MHNILNKLLNICLLFNFFSKLVLQKTIFMKLKNIKNLTRSELKGIVGGDTASCVCRFGGTVTVSVPGHNTSDLLAAADRACGFSGGVTRCVSNALAPNTDIW